MNRYEKNFHDILLNLSNNPLRLAESISLKSVSAFIRGYTYSLKENFDIDLLARWQQWIEIKFLILHVMWRWDRILEHCLGEDNAIQSLPSLYSEFIEKNIPYLEEKEFRDIHDRTFLENKSKMNLGIENTKTKINLDLTPKGYNPINKTKFEPKKTIWEFEKEE